MVITGGSAKGPRMPYYKDLLESSSVDEPTRRRTVDRLLELRLALNREVPRRSAHQVLLATWNIQRRWYRTYWRTRQMSDHLPLSVSLRSDYTNDYLTTKLDDL